MPVGVGVGAVILTGSPEALWPLHQADLQPVVSGAALKHLLIFPGASCNLGIRYLRLVAPVVPVALVDSISNLRRGHPSVAAVAQDVCKAAPVAGWLPTIIRDCVRNV